MTPPDAAAQHLLRHEAIAWANQQDDSHATIHYTALEHVALPSGNLRLKDNFKGIWKPGGWDAALSITTAFRPAGSDRPYDDLPSRDGLPRYKWQGDDPELAANRALRQAMKTRQPLIWFLGTAKGHYAACAPVWLIAEEASLGQFVVAVDQAQLGIRTDSPIETATRRFIETTVQRRIHQPVFRQQVIQAYSSHCSVCKLAHASLLDAAHITPDSDPDGLPIVSNGLALCKIHHAAYDNNILGIRPDHIVEIRPDILDENDGPMLEHGLKERHQNKLLWLPTATSNMPDSQRLERRYEEFRAAS